MTNLDATIKCEYISVESLSFEQCKYDYTFVGSHIMRTYIKGGQHYCHVVFFLGVSCLNFNHVIIMKDFLNVFACYDKSKLKEVKC